RTSNRDRFDRTNDSSLASESSPRRSPNLRRVYHILQAAAQDCSHILYAIPLHITPDPFFEGRRPGIPVRHPPGKGSRILSRRQHNLVTKLGSVTTEQR